MHLVLNSIIDNVTGRFEKILKLSLHKGTIMNKFTSSMLAVAMSVSVFSVSAATTTSNTDDASAIGTSETPQLKQKAIVTDSAPTKKSMSKKDRMHQKNKKMNSEQQDGANANSMNNKPIGTTNGVSNNGSTDDSKAGEPVNGTTTGTNNDNTSSTPKGY